MAREVADSGQYNVTLNTLTWRLLLISVQNPLKWPSSIVAIGPSFASYRRPFPLPVRRRPSRGGAGGLPLHLTLSPPSSAGSPPRLASLSSSSTCAGALWRASSTRTPPGLIGRLHARTWSLDAELALADRAPRAGSWIDRVPNAWRRRERAAPQGSSSSRPRPPCTGENSKSNKLFHSVLPSTPFTC
jgi:hypothetical protein